MAGLCAVCKNLQGKKFAVDGKEYDGCHCLKGKYDKEQLIGFYSLTNVVVKVSKEVKDIQDACDNWDYSLKGKDEVAI